jgi:hypothetical protein
VHRLGKRELLVVQRDVEGLAAELEEILAEVQNGKPITLEIKGKIDSWKYKVGSEQKLLATIATPMFTASQHYTLSLNHMQNAWNEFERSQSGAGTAKGDVLLHANSLKLMRESLKEAKLCMDQGKY